VICFCAVFFDPGFELTISRPVLFDELYDGVAVQAEAVDDHLIEACPCSGVTRAKLAGGFEGELEPKPGQMQNAERAGYAGGNQRNDCIHIRGVFLDLDSKLI
jgi:hypothetical protein